MTPCCVAPERVHKYHFISSYVQCNTTRNAYTNLTMILQCNPTVFSNTAMGELDSFNGEGISGDEALVREITYCTTTVLHLPFCISGCAPAHSCDVVLSVRISARTYVHLTIDIHFHFHHHCSCHRGCATMQTKYCCLESTCFASSMK
jgi:hypothetical protein